MHIIDVNKLDKILDTNKYLKDLIKNKTFVIKNGAIKLKCSIAINKNNGYSLKNFHYYEIKDKDDGFSLSFSKEWLPSLDEVYIGSLKKTKLNSGSNILDTLIKFIVKFESVKKIKLIDEAYINCPTKSFKYNLSLFGLLTTKNTFYNKYNFRSEPSNVITEKKINKIIDSCANTKVKDIIKELKSNSDILKSLKIPKNINKIAKANRDQKNTSNTSNNAKLTNEFNIFNIYGYIVILITILEDNLNNGETFKDLLIRLRKNKKCEHIATIINACQFLSYELIYFPKKSMSFIYYFKQLNDINRIITTKVYYIEKINIIIYKILNNLFIFNAVIKFINKIIYYYKI